MKTAISIPDPLFKKAEKVAKELGISRSQLYSEAVEEFIQIHSSDSITRTLNEVYQKEESTLDPVLYALQLGSMPKEDKW